MVGTGLLAVLLLVTLLGGYSRLGANTNAGWFALIVALMCLPFGLMLLALGVAKWFRNRRQARIAHENLALGAGPGPHGRPTPKHRDNHP
jgi:hypothetical protein